MPSVVIPMHYKTEDVNLDIDDADAFLDYFDEEAVEYVENGEIEFDRADFDDGFTTKVICFDKN